MEPLKNHGDFEEFIIKNGINYVYIRLGGRGYGEKGNFYSDESASYYAQACDFLGVPYGFYFLDEALNEQELIEEVQFVQESLKNLKCSMNVLPLAIDLEYQEGKGRADKIWDTRTELLEKLISKFKEEDIETIIYSNAKRAVTYLKDLNTNFWVARYYKDDQIPSNSYSGNIAVRQLKAFNEKYTDEQGLLNNQLNKGKDLNLSYSEDFYNKIIGWQFSEDGASKDGIDAIIDLSIVENNFFKQFMK